MPPIRTPTIKPVKTERTHEENQERAYIAASRRSDRSLEARIESARRASEIHKKRTGRALRVTEQDVVNEEMYEEEDDDLPAQYRRLQSHLQTGSWEFNRRLQAYMATQLGTRNALMQQSHFGGPYPNAPFFANQFGQAQQQPTILNPQMLHMNQGYRQAPYSMSPPGLPGAHQRAASISSPHDFANYVHTEDAKPTPSQFSNEDPQQRRMSFPPQASHGSDGVRPPLSQTASVVGASDGASASPHNAAGTSPPAGQQSPASAGAKFSNQPAAMYGGFPLAVNNNAFAPFSTSLPPETQQLLSQPASLENPNSYNPYWFTGNVPPSSYSYKPNSGSRSDSPGSKSVGTAADPTLSLNPLDTSAAVHDATSHNYVTSASTDGSATPFSDTFGTYGYGFDSFLGPDGQQDPSAIHLGSGESSGVVTPGGADWTNFLVPFEDTGASQS